jgi:hypothetical protein
MKTDLRKKVFFFITLFYKKYADVSRVELNQNSLPFYLRRRWGKEGRLEGEN